MNTYRVKFSVDGRAAGELYVEARDSFSAKRVALGELQGRAGYYGKRINVTSVLKVS